MEQINESSVHHLPRLSAGIVVQVLSRDGKLKFLSPLVEAVGDVLVVDRLPSVSDMPEDQSSPRDIAALRDTYFKFNQTLLIRTIDRGVVYSCETRVLEVSEQRARLQVYTAPREIYRQYQRHEHRFSCALCAYLHGHCASADGKISDISSCGCQLTLSDDSTIAEVRDLQIHDKPLNFEVLFPHDDSYRQLQGKVVSLINDDEHHQVRVGVEFRSGAESVAEYINLLRLY